jgi:hypothetical protein
VSTPPQPAEWMEIGMKNALNNQQIEKLERYLSGASIASRGFDQRGTAAL